MSTTVECSKVSVVTNDRAVNPRTYSVIGGIALGARRLLVNGRSVHTLKTSIVERVFFCCKNGKILSPLKPEQGAFSRLVKFKMRLLACFGSKPSCLAPEEFVDMYKGRRRTIYQNALEEFYQGVKAKHARIRPFVKAEKVKEAAPRCIQPRSPVYNIGVGVYIKHIEHRIYKSIARVFRQRMVVSKGLNVVDLGNQIFDLWSEIADPCFIGFDATRFDMHVSVPALRWEHSIYLWLYDYDPELQRLLKMQLHNTGVGYCDDGTLRYNVHGRRMSGDMNTGLGNCILMCAMAYHYLSNLNIPFRFINNGDDCGVILPRIHAGKLNGIVDEFRQYGFRLEVEPMVTELEQVEFCQMNPVYDGENWRMVRKTFSALSKDTMSLIPFSNQKLMRKWLYSVGECGLALCSGIPVMQEVYRTFMRLGIPSNIGSATYMECGAMLLARGLEARYKRITDEARYSYYLASGIYPDEQEGLEEYYSSIQGPIVYSDLDNFIQFPNPTDIQ